MQAFHFYYIQYHTVKIQNYHSYMIMISPGTGMHVPICAIHYNVIFKLHVLILILTNKSIFILGLGVIPHSHVNPHSHTSWYVFQYQKMVFLAIIVIGLPFVPIFVSPRCPVAPRPSALSVTVSTSDPDMSVAVTELITGHAAL